MELPTRYLSGTGLKKNWWILYADAGQIPETADVAYCYGNQIGIASSDDHGQSWVYRGTLDLDIEPGHNTILQAPDYRYHYGKYHMFVSYHIQGVRNHWAGMPAITHYTSKIYGTGNMQESSQINSNIIDPTFIPDSRSYFGKCGTKTRTAAL